MRTLIASVALVASLAAQACAGEFLVFPGKIEDGKLTFRHFSMSELYGKRDESTQDSTLAVAADVKILNTKLISIEGASTELIGPYNGDKKSFVTTVALRARLAEKRAIEEMTTRLDAVGIPMEVVLVMEGDSVKEIRVIQNLIELLLKKK